VARLATINARGGIDVVPITFAFVDDDTIVYAVDHKPKRTLQLRRLENIRTTPTVTVLIDHYDEDWSSLWWVRLRGDARVVNAPDDDLLQPLVRKYEQYRDRRPEGAAVVIRVSEITSWSAAG
jgi:PPOX class probable F420-dependent enzyme